MMTVYFSECKRWENVKIQQGIYEINQYFALSKIDSVSFNYFLPK